MSIRILTDSNCDLPSDIIHDYDIDVLPILICLGDKEYEDGITIDSYEVYKNMKQGSVYKTAQIPPNEFKKKFRQCADNKETCIYIAFSSGLSGTYQSSILAKNEIQEEYPDLDVTVIDTKCACMGQGLVVLKAAKMAKEGRSKEEILEAVKFYSEHMEHIVTVEDLEYLYRGGRVSRTSAFIGGLLNVKPIIDVRDGKLVPFEKLRGRNKVIKRIMDIVDERGKSLEKQTIAIAHADDLETAIKIKEMIEERFKCRDILITVMGCAIGSHVGPGTVAVFFLNEESPI
ncbi:EDD domain protein, DegV family [Gottschalkia purinilytica]|uniref:EDD domain protein, DegV family n=1 Tax=Gottschalkia purinilytica TaxID=1503 RepID=A0A0L0W918_GOTPU|nr:DegV family protein [Gottschalkia purinilytica]KNF07946.1 EDD domain protein, DegV family [Gottschalkia purinilytica]